MKTLAVILFGLLMVVSTSGCCGWCGHGYRPGFSSGYGGNCPGGACGIGGTPVVPPQGFYDGGTTIQSGYAPSAAGPVYHQAGYSQTAAIPLDPLPTY